MATIKKCTAILVVIIGFLTSCQYNDETEVFTRDYTVNPRDWNVGTDDESGDYFYYEFRESNLTQRIYNNGIMQAFLLMNDGNLTPLPFNDYWVDETGYKWTEQVTCEFRPGFVTFILKYSDHEVAIDPYTRTDLGYGLCGTAKSPIFFQS